MHRLKGSCLLEGLLLQGKRMASKTSALKGLVGCWPLHIYANVNMRRGIGHVQLKMRSDIPVSENSG